MNNSTDENIIEIQKNYSEEIISEIQNVVNNNTAEIKVLTDISELPNTVYIDNVKIVLSYTNDLYDSCLFVNSDSVSKKWKTCSTYTFLCKDWKRLNKGIDIFENNNYLEIKFNVKDANFTALLRRVDIELAEDSFALMEYGEIYYNDAQYVIIKAFSPSIDEDYSTKSILENITEIPNKIYDNFGYEITIDSNGKANIENNEIVTNDDIDNESEELF